MSNYIAFVQWICFGDGRVWSETPIPNRNQDFISENKLKSWKKAMKDAVLGQETIRSAITQNPQSVPLCFQKVPVVFFPFCYSG